MDNSEKQTNIFNIYCDESCHLECDQQNAMVLGALWSNYDISRAVAKRIKAIKIKHGLSPSFEIKWTKISPGKIDFYSDILDYFFEEKELHFRALVIKDKSKLRHERFNQDHDTWYYKMYFEMLKALFHPQAHYRIYLDIKDTRSGDKVRQLHDVLCNSNYDFKRQIIERVQTVRSHEIEQLQLVDLLIGCVLSANRNHQESPAKRQLVEKMKRLSGYELTKTTLVCEKKVNIFCWSAREVSDV